MSTQSVSHALPSTFDFVPMTAPYARALLAWQYDPPYDVYNADPDMDKADIADSFLNPAYHYYAVLDAQGDLIAYRCFGGDARVPGGDYSVDALDMGVGLRPDLTGRGLGPQVMCAAMTFARVHFAPRAFRTTVAAWNTRAQRACSKVGYQALATFHSPHGAPYVIMLRDALEDGRTHERAMNTRLAGAGQEGMRQSVKKL